MRIAGSRSAGEANEVEERRRDSGEGRGRGRLLYGGDAFKTQSGKKRCERVAFWQPMLQRCPGLQPPGTPAAAMCWRLQFSTYVNVPMKYTLSLRWLRYNCSGVEARWTWSSDCYMYLCSIEMLHRC